MAFLVLYASRDLIAYVQGHQFIWVLFWGVFLFYRVWLFWEFPSALLCGVCLFLWPFACVLGPGCVFFFFFAALFGGLCVSVFVVLCVCSWFLAVWFFYAVCFYSVWICFNQRFDICFRSANDWYRWGTMKLFWTVFCFMSSESGFVLVMDLYFALLVSVPSVECSTSLVNLFQYQLWSSWNPVLSSFWTRLLIGLWSCFF